MNKDECYNLGYISKTQGFKGMLIAFFDVDNTAEYSKLDSLFIEINDKLIPFFIEQLDLKEKNFVRLKFEGVSDEEGSRDLVGKSLWLPLSVLPELSDDEYYLHELEGMEVIDKNLGTLGKVSAVLDFQVNQLLQIEREKGEILIPINDAMIERVDKKSRIIYVSTPEGLVDVNL